MPTKTRELVRRLGIGKYVLKINNLRRQGGVFPLAKTAYVRRTLLPAILRAPPISVGVDGEVEIKMLLHKKRFLDGLWGLYSFLHYCDRRVAVTVHSDGSLDQDCVSAMKTLLPGVRVIDRGEADRAVMSILVRNSLTRCAQLRSRLNMALKLIDFLVIREKGSFIMLDSDILTYANPVELLSPPRLSTGKKAHLFSVDNNDYSYALPIETIEDRLGYGIARRLNAGLMHIQAESLSLEMYEQCLDKTQILTDARTSMHYAEQTVYAAVLGFQGAVPLNAVNYTICGGPEESITAHYCGGGYWGTRLYREGIPHLASKWGL
jgi:hypothetical protein